MTPKFPDYSWLDNVKGKWIEILDILKFFLDFQAEGSKTN